jgi:DNA polymerase III subunit epsilon
MERQVILDTETTGLSTQEKHRIIEVGCLEMVDRRFSGRNFHCYINPQRPVDKGAFEVHGLSDEFLKDKPLFIDIKQSLLEFIQGAQLIIHNASFDLEFLNYEFKLGDQTFLPMQTRWQVIDTLVLARNKHPGQSNSLDALCRRYQIDNSKRHLHGALIDAELLGKVYLAMTSGQDKLFLEEALSTVTVQAESYQSKTDRLPLSVLLPNEQELAAHATFMALLNKKQASD